MIRQRQVDMHRFRLPDPIDPVCCLSLFGRIPMPLEMNGVVRTDNSQPDTDCQRRHDDEVESRSRFEVVDDAFAGSSRLRRAALDCFCFTVDDFGRESVSLVESYREARLDGLADDEDDCLLIGISNVVEDLNHPIDACGQIRVPGRA